MEDTAFSITGFIVVARDNSGMINQISRPFRLYADAVEFVDSFKFSVVPNGAFILALVVGK